MPGKRILIIYNRIPYPLNDGGNIAVYTMIEGYKREGWQVCLLAMNTSRHRIAAGILKDIYTDIYGFDAVDVDNDVRPIATLRNYLFSSLPEHAQRFHVAAFASKLSEVLQHFKPDVIQLESVFLSSYLPLMRRESKAKIALRMHNVEGQIWERSAQETAGPLKKFYLSDLAKRMQRYEHEVWKQYDLLIPITDVDAKAVSLSAPGVAQITIPVGIDTSVIASHKETEKWIGYHIGAMDWLPNKDAIAWFIKDIWPVIHSKLPDFTFQFAGRNMPAEISMLNADGVLCVGEVADANAFIADKKILIVPLRSGGGIRVKILEAMALGKVVICTDVAIQGINAVAGMHYLPANDAEGFAKAIEWTLDNKKEAIAMGAHAAHLVGSRYDMFNLARKLSDRQVALLANR